MPVADKQIRCKINFNTKFRCCKLTIKKSRKIENYEPYKASDRRFLHAEAKIIVALMKRQPQTLEDLCKRAGISTSTFYRVRRLLKNYGIIKAVEKGYALWNYIERKDLWTRMKERLEQYGGILADLEVDRYEGSTGKKEPRTSWSIPKFGNRESIKGIMILKKALELSNAAEIDWTRAPANVPEASFSYEIAIVTPDYIKSLDRIWWNDKSYTIIAVKEIYDAYKPSYRTAILRERIA